MSERLADKVAVVTGGGRGIGEATCRRFAEEGADVVVADVLAEEAESVAADLESEFDAEALAVETDVSDERAVEEMAERAESRFGRVDVLVNNAGIRVEPRPVTEADEESWDRILDVNLKGAAFCAKHLIPLMDDGGSVVNVASNGAEVARPDWAQYDSTKGAMVSMTKDMACDHAPEGVRVNAVSPGWVITEFHPPRRLRGSPRVLRATDHAPPRRSRHSQTRRRTRGMRRAHRFSRLRRGLLYHRLEPPGRRRRLRRRERPGVGAAHLSLQGPFCCWSRLGSR